MTSTPPSGHVGSPMATLRKLTDTPSAPLAPGLPGVPLHTAMVPPSGKTTTAPPPAHCGLMLGSAFAEIDAPDGPAGPWGPCAPVTPVAPGTPLHTNVVPLADTTATPPKGQVRLPASTCAVVTEFPIGPMSPVAPVMPAGPAGPTGPGSPRGPGGPGSAFLQAVSDSTANAAIHEVRMRARYSFYSAANACGDASCHAVHSERLEERKAEGAHAPPPRAHGTMVPMFDPPLKPFCEPSKSP